ncbi:hypothetical protein CCR75_000259 [Bremia lactucae]|uniref:Telomeric single stranded DNA binding POT1/Cdc13 domain-containing protein n=1 Tax=Bremia lactucae TaxID=4779 RepID=A0A976FDY9_BRELC|nr:hypothetical protein CCR75_000259 [Bremia lactucae]
MPCKLKSSVVARKWARTSLAFDDTLPLGCPQAPKLLFDLKAAEDFIDLVVRVLHVVDSDEAVRLIIWDGSGNAAESDHALVSALQNKGVDIPPHGLLKEVIMSSCWSVVQEMGFVDEMLASWCRFRNLAVGRNELLPDTALASGIREILRFREVTSFVLMPEFSLDIQRRCSLNKCSNPNPTINFQRRRSNENVAEPNQVVEIRTIIPDHIFKSVPVTPLREILNSLQIPRKYHCRAFFRSVWPDIEKICKPKSDKSDEYIYSFALSVQEGNESMNIIVYGNDAAHFLHGIPPCDLSKSTSSKTLLQKRFAALFQASKASHLCIKSYYVSLPPGHSSGSINAVRYRLFHTLLQYEEHE